MATFELQADHLSGKYDRPAKRLVRQVRLSLAAGTTLATLTEVDRPYRAKALRSISGTRTLRAPKSRGETAILADKSVWKVLDWGFALISPPFGARRGVMLTWAVLKHRKTGALGLISVAHYHSNVEARWHARVKWAMDHRRAVGEARKMHKQIRKRWRKAGRPLSWELHAADFNLSLHRAWVRTWIRSAWPALKAIPKQHTPKQGSLGPRLIDWFLSRGVKRRRMEVLAKHPASDHRGVRIAGCVRVRKKP